MANLIWDKFEKDDKEYYIDYLKIFGALSGLFKDNLKGLNAKKPYLHYRNHEQLYARIFNVEDLTRKDSAFDAIAEFEDGKYGIGLKTWIHTQDRTYQKVAEFNKLAPIEVTPFITERNPIKAITKIAELRNKRIMLDKRLYGTDYEVYHYITRTEGAMNIVETNYDFIDISRLRLLSSSDKSLSFTDGTRNYKYYTSKSVLLEEFDASKDEIIVSVPIEQYDDPFELIYQITLDNNTYVQESSASYVADSIYLPIYSDSNFNVEEKSAFNMQLGASKTKGSGRKRPAYEVYIPVPIWIHYIFPCFFGVDPFDKESIRNSEGFWLHLPDGRKVKARNTQQNGKSLQTNPQSILGEWILRDVFGLEPYERLTKQMLDEYGVDSFRITRIGNKNYRIDLAETWAFEKWKLQLKDEIYRINRSSIKRWKLPNFRPDLIDEDK